MPGEAANPVFAAGMPYDEPVAGAGRKGRGATPGPGGGACAPHVRRNGQRLATAWCRPPDRLSGVRRRRSGAATRVVSHAPRTIRSVTIKPSHIRCLTVTQYL